MAVTTESLRRKLLEERDRLTSELAVETEREQALGAESGAECSMHPADEGVEMAEQEKGTSLRRRLELMLDDVNRGLHKMETGAYGKCERCGQPIASERLAVRPQARLCIDCQRETERMQEIREMAWPVSE